MELQSVFSAVVNQAGAKTVYTEPVSVDGRTMVGVARVRCGFGGGSGKNGHTREEEGRGGGGGGGFVARPVGFVEIDSQGSRFVPIIDPQAMFFGIGLGLGMGWALGRFLFHK